MFLGHGTTRSLTRCGWNAASGDFRDRPLRDLAVRLVNDMLAQANRVALEKMQPDASGRLQMYSRIYERNGRYYKTRDEGDGAIGTRLEVAAGIAVQLGLIDLAAEGAAAMTGLGSRCWRQRHERRVEHHLAVALLREWQGPARQRGPA